MMVHLQPSQSFSQSVAGKSQHYSLVPDSPRKLAMAVAAMVARQMRENQQRKDGPSSNWTEEERNLFELQQKSKSTLKVTDIILTEVKGLQDNRDFFYFSQSWCRTFLRKTSHHPPVLQSTTISPCFSPFWFCSWDSSSPL